MNCDHCRWWSAFTDKEGICRRYPPMVVYTAAAVRETVWPQTHPHDGCGEFQPKEKRDAR